ncbi:MAG: hypothetical protein IT292_00230 [Deltaproteobacteria bacterium]|nr:hypothetical protein [Deltaproteobacteria bacterium]
MRNIYTKITNILFAFVILILFSCSLNGDDIQQPIVNTVSAGAISVDIFAAHGFLGGSSYERYYLENNKLWRECGSLDDEQTETKPSAFPDVFLMHPTIVPKDASFETLSNDLLGRISAALVPLQSYPAKNPKKTDKAGSLFSLSGGGVFELSYSQNSKKFKISTSLSAISNAETVDNRNVNELFSLIRGIGPDICGSKIFFGVGKKSN